MSSEEPDVDEYLDDDDDTITDFEDDESISED